MADLCVNVAPWGDTQSVGAAERLTVGAYMSASVSLLQPAMKPLPSLPIQPKSSVHAVPPPI